MDTVNNNTSANNSGISTGAAVGIGLGVLAATGVGCFLLGRRNGRKHPKSEKKESKESKEA